MGAMLNLYSPRVTELLKPMAYGEVTTPLLIISLVSVADSPFHQVVGVDDNL